MRELVALVIHPTNDGWILLPILLVWRIISMCLAMLPDCKATLIIWDFADSTAESVSEVIYNSIKTSPNPWDYKFFK